VAITAVAGLRCLARFESPTSPTRRRAPSPAPSLRAVPAAFVEDAKSWLHLDIYGWTPSAKPARPEGGDARPRAAIYNCSGNAMDDPRLTPARPDLAAKYLEGKIEAACFVEGREFEISDALAPLREGPSSDAMLATRR